MPQKRELINLTITNNSDCALSIPLFQNNVASINATTKYAWLLDFDYSCGYGSIVVNGTTYTLSYDGTLASLLSALNALKFGLFCSETVGGNLYVYTIDDTNVYGVLDLCTAATTTTTTTTTTVAPTTTTTTTTTTEALTTTTTTTTTTAFTCADCRNWEYQSGNIPVGGDVITYYSCVDGSIQSIALSFGDPTGTFCNCNSLLNPPTTINGTILTEIGICIITTTTTTTTTLSPP